jgi:hypothetical protein
VAIAVEQSDMLLMCVSQKYKDSPNCRLEGEYCMNRRIEFVPLMMQRGYKPDGWYVFCFLLFYFIICWLILNNAVVMVIFLQAWN